MAKFCGRCGSKLNENGICPSCDNTVAMFSQQEIEKQQKELRKEYEKQQKKEEKKEEKEIEKKIKKAEKKAAKKAERKAKKKAKWNALTKKQKTTRIIIKLVAFLLGLLVVATLVCGVLCYFNIVDIPVVNSMLSAFGLKNNPPSHSATISYNDRVYYAPNARLYDITDPDNIKEVTIKTYERVPLFSQNVYHDGTIYGRDIDSLELYKYTIDEDGDIDRELWVDEDDFEDAGMFEYSAPAFRSPVVCGDYVYFSYQQNMEFYNNELDMEKGYGYNLCRISFDGEIEFFEDIHAATLATDGKYIYFLDNGYVRYSTQEEDRIGLYKFEGNADPEDAQLITSDLDIDFDKYEGFPEHIMFEKMMLVDDTIYYLETNSSRQNKLFRMDTDGNNRELVTDDPVALYDIDENNKTLYYVDGPSISVEPFSVYALTLDSDDKDFLFKVDSKITAIDINDGYLYIQNSNGNNLPGENKEAKVMGLRYNTGSEKMEVMYGFYEGGVEEVLDPETGAYSLSINRGKLSIYFEEEKVDSEKVYNVK